jgi:hypothetical protein
MKWPLPASAQSSAIGKCVRAILRSNTCLQVSVLEGGTYSYFLELPMRYHGQFDINNPGSLDMIKALVTALKSIAGERPKKIN